MAQPKFTWYKRVKINGEWRYFRAAVAGNNKVKPHIVLVGGQEETLGAKRANSRARLCRKPLLSSEVKIRLIHEHRSTLLNRMFDELCLKAPGRSAEQVEHDIIVAARSHPEGFLELRRNPTPDAGLLVLALHQIVDSFIAGLLREEAFEWLAERQKLADQIAPECADPTDGGH